MSPRPEPRLNDTTSEGRLLALAVACDIGALIAFNQHRSQLQHGPGTVTGTAWKSLVVVASALCIASIVVWMGKRRRKRWPSEGVLVGSITVLLVGAVVGGLVSFTRPKHVTFANVLAFEGRTGARLWSRQTDVVWLGPPVADGIAVDVDGAKGTPCQSKWYRLEFDRQTGRYTTREIANRGNPDTPAPDAVPPADTPAASYRIGRNPGRLIRVGADGKELWSAPIPISSSNSQVRITATSQNVYVASDGNWPFTCGSD